MEEEIDLRPYILALVSRWYWIFGTGMVAAVIAFGLTSLLPETYEAEATLAIIRSRTEVSFDTRIVSLEGEELGDLDLDSRREALVALVTNNDIAAQVLQNVQDSLAPEEQTVPELLEMVEGKSNGDLVIITAQYQDPVIAARIVNQWADVYAPYVNDLYSTDRLDNVETTRQQVDAAAATYEQAQAAFTAFVGDNQIARLEREIQTQQGVLNAYQAARNELRAQPVSLQVNTQQQMLADYYADLQRIERWLADAAGFREQVERGEASQATNLSNVLTLIGLQSRVFGGAAPAELQVGLGEDGGVTAVSVEDVDTIITLLEERRAATEEEISDRLTRLATIAPTELELASSSALVSRITTLNEEILELEAALTEQEDKRRRLAQARDLAWETYQSLLRKEAEVAVAAQTDNTEVRAAGRAVPPEEPVGPGRLVSTAVAGLLGAMLSIVFVLGKVSWEAGKDNVSV